MKKIMMIFAMASLSLHVLAQEDMTMESEGESLTMGQKHSVSTNSFWNNWFVQAGVADVAFWGNQEKGAGLSGSPFKGFRSRVGFSLALGKWFTPGIGLRTKFDGVWGRTVVGADKEVNKSRYWTLNEQVLLNLSNMLYGYNADRLYNFIPYVGASWGRNTTYHTKSLGMNFGLLNSFRVSRRLSVDLDLCYGIHEPGFDGVSAPLVAGGDVADRRDKTLHLEFGISYRLGRTNWNKTPDVEGMRVMQQSEIDALNAQIQDLQMENEELREQSKQK